MYAGLDAAWHQQQTRASQNDEHEADSHRQGGIRLSAHGGDDGIGNLNEGNQKEYQQMSFPVAQYTDQAYVVVNFEELDDDGYQRQHQQAVDDPAQEAKRRLPLPWFGQEKTAYTLNKEHAPSPEIHQIQFSYQLVCQFKPEFQHATNNDAQRTKIGHKGKCHQRHVDVWCHIFLMIRRKVLSPQYLHLILGICIARRQGWAMPLNFQ